MKETNKRVPKLTRHSFHRHFRNKHQQMVGGCSGAFMTAMKSPCCPGRIRIRVGWRSWCVERREALRLKAYLGACVRGPK